MALAPGTRLGPYAITAPLGAGGMGEVYRATDTRLGRDVAIKVVPPAFSTDPERLQRFEQEARAAAALNHPNILAVYDIGQHDGAPYIVSELLQGETLRERLNASALPVRKAVEYAIQIAHGLAAAHEKGIMHRDLKPENVFVTTDGRVKILDFGLAKLTQGESALVGVSNLPTTPPHTVPGMVLGTIGYMAPEQVRGLPADHRSDIFAFGAILYELLSGVRAFHRETGAETMTAILKEDPPELSAVDRHASPALVRIVTRCLEKSPGVRFQSTRDLAFALEGLFTTQVAPVEPVPATSLRRLVNNAHLAWSVAAVLLAVVAVTLIAGTVAYLRYRPAESPPIQFIVQPPEGWGPAGDPAVSPDGRRLAFVASDRDGQGLLWVRSLETVGAQPLKGTEDAQRPFWSPDSRFIAFFAGGKLKKIDVIGGPALTLCDAGDPRGGSWGSKDVIVFAPAFGSRGLFRVAAAGGTATQVTALDQGLNENSHRLPWFLPDGRHFLFTARVSEADKTTVYVGDIESTDRRRVLAVSSNAVYTAPGYLLYLRERAVMAQAFDANEAVLSGEAVPVAEEVNYDVLNVNGAFSTSQTGVLAYISGSPAGSEQLQWFDRSGKALGAVGVPGEIGGVALSPDGKTIAFDQQDPETTVSDVWLHDLARGSDSRFTLGPPSNRLPVWSPDGGHIAFASVRPAVGVVFQRAVGAAGRDEVLVLDIASGGEGTFSARDWSRDGRYVIGNVSGGKTREDISALPLFGERRLFPYLQTASSERDPKLSPGGQWVAYVSDETKRNEVYVQSFPVPGRKLQVSTTGGDRPVWSRDGRELFFIGADGKMMAVNVKTGSTFEAGIPKPVFDVRIGGDSSYDVSNDGRFLIPTVLEQGTSVPVTVVMNWMAGLKK